VVVGDFSAPLSAIGHPNKKINKETQELNDLTDLYRVFYPAITQYTF
jgi:hypothetical protein